MKKLSFMIAVSSAVFLVLSWSAAVAQTKEATATAEEKKAAQDIADRFVKRLNETGDIEPLIKEMFVPDFMGRYVKEGRQRVQAGEESAREIMFTFGLEYDPRLLETASDEDWRALYVNTFNFINYGITFMVNEGAKAKAAGKEMSDDDMEKVFAKTYPLAGMKLINSNLILRNMYMRGNDDRPIKNVEELREVNKALAEVNGLVIGKPDGKMTVEAQAAIKKASEKFDGMTTPHVSVCERECFGFERGTRLIALFASPMHALVMAKVGADYKILSAQISSYD